MLTTLTLQYFKSVCNKTTLQIAPLTIFAGANSSGKSTIIQSLLLTTQTLQNPVPSHSVILNGYILRIGAFNDIVYNQESENILIGFELKPTVDEHKSSMAISRCFHALHINEVLSSTSCSFVFSSRASKDKKEITQLYPSLEECQIGVKYKLENISNEEVIEIRRSKKTVQQRIKDNQISEQSLSKPEVASLEYEIVKPDALKYYAFPENAKPLGALLNHFLPGKISFALDALEEQSRQIIDLLLGREEAYFQRTRDILLLQNIFNENLKVIILSIFTDAINENYADEIFKQKKAELLDVISELNTNFMLDKLMKFIYDLPIDIRQAIKQKILEKEKSDKLVQAIKAGRNAEYQLAYFPLPEMLELAVDYTQEFFTRFVKYLAPQRDEPKPVYSLGCMTDSKDVGFKGEHTAAVLEVHRNTKVEYIPSEQLKSGAISLSPISEFLPKAVLDWLEYMGIASDIKTVDKGKLGYELKVVTGKDGALHDLTNVGVGVSQVLPILVQSLLAEKGSTLIFEQPELHLHPRVQTRLADFFISMIMLKKQCIIETHSEYLINRLRYLAAASEGENISQNVLMYFVDKQNGESVYRPIKLNKFGVLEDWPKGFFDENEENARAVLKAAIEKRKKETIK